MGKLSLIAAVVLSGLSVAGSIQPAAAASMATCQSEKVLNDNGVFVDKIQLYRDTIAMRLRREGYNVSSVEPWGGCVRAFVTMPDGSTKNQFFDPDTLEPVY
jgi:hypothetical protein